MPYKLTKFCVPVDKIIERILSMMSKIFANKEVKLSS